MYQSKTPLKNPETQSTGPSTHISAELAESWGEVRLTLSSTVWRTEARAFTQTYTVSSVSTAYFEAGLT